MEKGFKIPAGMLEIIDPEIERFRVNFHKMFINRSGKCRLKNYPECLAAMIRSDSDYQSEEETRVARHIAPRD